MSTNDTLIQTGKFLIEIQDHLKDTRDKIILLASGKVDSEPERSKLLTNILEDIILTRFGMYQTLNLLETECTITYKKQEQKNRRKSKHDKPGAPNPKPPVDTTTPATSRKPTQ